MNRNFKGIYASLIREFVSLKRSMGFKYIGGEFVLTLFVLCWIKRMALSSHNIFSNFKFAISEALKPSIVANRIIE